MSKSSRIAAFAIVLFLAGFVVVWIQQFRGNRVEFAAPRTGNSAPFGQHGFTEIVTGRKDLVQVHAELFAVSRTKALDSGFDWNGNGGPFCVLQDEEAIKDAQFIRSLLNSGVASKMAESTVVTQDGRPASDFFDQGEVQCPALKDTQGVAASQRIGTQFDVLPQLVGEEKFKLKLQMDSRGVPEQVVRNGSQLAGVHASNMACDIGGKLGEITILKWNGTPQGGEEVQYLLALRVESYDSTTNGNGEQVPVASVEDGSRIR